MPVEWTYRDYVVKDPGFMRAYEQYQQRYRRRVRESDRVLLELVREVVAERPRGSPRATLLDMGCASGNFLLHLRHLLPDIALTGGDIAAPVIRACREDPELAGIHFREMDILNAPADARFDIVVANAVLFAFEAADFERALQNIATLVKPGGTFLAFDWFHPFEQEVTIVERSRDYPQGVRFHQRPYAGTAAMAEKSGFSGVQFQPFHVPLDLPRSEDPADLTSHTVRTDSGERLSFRGVLHQPWCHLRATRAA